MVLGAHPPKGKPPVGCPGSNCSDVITAVTSLDVIASPQLPPESGACPSGGRSCFQESKGLPDSFNGRKKLSTSFLWTSEKLGGCLECCKAGKQHASGVLLHQSPPQPSMRSFPPPRSATAFRSVKRGGKSPGRDRDFVTPKAVHHVFRFANRVRFRKEFNNTVVFSFAVWGKRREVCGEGEACWLV